MKTVLFIDSSGQRYFQRLAGSWRLVAAPTRKDTLWVLVNLPAESLELIDLPRISGRDRRNFLERRLKGLFPDSSYRTAHILSGGMFKPGKVMLTGFTATHDIVGVEDGHAASFAGLWGVSSVLGMMARRYVPSDILLVLPSAHELRILVVKDRVPVLTRYIYCDGYNNADEILLTRNYLEDQQIFEDGKFPPVLFLGDSSAVEAALITDGLTLLPVPKEFLPKGEAAWLHPLFNHLVSSPPEQLAPFSLRAPYLAQKVGRTAYSVAAVTLLAACLYGLDNWRAFIDLQLREQSLHAELRRAKAERDRLSTRVSTFGADPALVRRATEFATAEITAAPGVETFFSLAAVAIADVQEARVKTLTFHLVPNNATPCQAKSASQPATNPAEKGGPALKSQRQGELELAVLLPNELPPRAKAEARQRITTALQGVSGSTVLRDPSTVASGGILKGGAGVSADKVEDRWCLGVSWQTPVIEGKEGV